MGTTKCLRCFPAKKGAFIGEVERELCGLRRVMLPLWTTVPSSAKWGRRDEVETAQPVQNRGER